MAMAKYIPLSKYGGMISDSDYVNLEPKGLKYYGKCSDGSTIWVTNGGHRVVREILDWNEGTGHGSDEI